MSGMSFPLRERLGRLMQVLQLVVASQSGGNHLGKERKKEMYALLKEHTVCRITMQCKFISAKQVLV
ncbi:unnamed protein product [Urochloa humidicola]